MAGLEALLFHNRQSQTEKAPLRRLDAEKWGRIGEVQPLMIFFSEGFHTATVLLKYEKLAR